MKISTEKLPESQVRLEIEVEPERVEKSMDRAYRRLVGKYRIPGFRPGKAPRIMFERYVGRQTLIREALESLLPEVYEEAVKEESLDPIDQPQFEIDTLEPLLFKATVPLRPQVNLGDYRAVRVPREPVTVDAAEVDKAIEDLRKRYATLAPVERPVQLGDVIRADVTAAVDGRELLNETDAEIRVTTESLTGLPGLADNLVGSEKDHTYDFEVDVPEEHEQKTLAGKNVSYHITIHEVKQEELPTLDDAFASEVGEGFASLAALRERIEADQLERANKEADSAYQQNVLKEITAGGRVRYPPVLVDREIEYVINEQYGNARSRAVLDATLRRAGLTEEQFRESLRPTAVDRVERTLVLTRLAEQEGITVTPEEIAAELEELAPPSATGNTNLREVFDSESGRAFIERTLLTRKVYERLRDLGEGKELPPQAVESEPLEPEDEPEPEAAAETEVLAEAGDAGPEAQADGADDSGSEAAPESIEAVQE